MTRKLSVKHERAIECLLAGGDYLAAAKAAGVQQRTIYRWLDFPLFHTELSKGKSKAIDAASVRLAGGMDKAIGVIMRIMDDQDAAPSIQLRAADLYLAHSIKYIELNDVIARIEALEERYET